MEPHVPFYESITVGGNLRNKLIVKDGFYMKFRKSTLFLSLFSLMVLSSTAFSVQGPTTTTPQWDFSYTVSGGNATITGYSGCPNVGSITIPSTIGSSNYPVTSIGDLAFYGCTGLTSITIPDSVTSIVNVNNVFNRCTGLTSIIVDANNTVYSSQDGVLYNKAMTVLIFYPQGKSGGFTIPDSVTSIEHRAFSYCTGLTSVTIPSSVTSIGEGAFYSCGGLTSVTIPNSVTSIEVGAFLYCTGLTSVTIPDSVTSIGDEAFQYCTYLTSVTIPDSVTSIGSYAFCGCSGLTSVTIGNSVTSIGSYAFYGCSGLTSVTIPDSVTSIGSYAFTYCSGLTNAFYLGNAPSMGWDVFGDCASNFTVGHTAESTGFTTPWCPANNPCYPEVTISSTTTVPSTTTTTAPSTTTTSLPTTTTTVQPTTSSSTSSIIPTTTTTIQPTQSYLPLAIAALNDAINLETQARDTMMSSAITVLRAFLESSKTKIGEALTNIAKAKKNGELSKLSNLDILFAQSSLIAASVADTAATGLLKKDSSQTRKAAQVLIKAAISLKQLAKTILTK